MKKGVNVDPDNPSGRPSPSLLKDIGFDTVRLVLRPSVLTYVLECYAAGLTVMGVLARESGDPEQYTGWPLDMVAVGNEMDVTGESSWTMRPEDYWMLWERCRMELPGVPLLIGAMASGIVEKAADYCAIQGASGICVHPYGKSAEQARVLLESYQYEYGLPIYVSEWWRPAWEIKSFLDATGWTEGAWWFCWSDGMVSPFGLVAPDGYPKEAYFAMEEALNVPEFLFGFKAKADELGEEVVGRPVEDEHYFPDGSTSLQMTTKGLMVYSKPGNQVGFIPFAQKRV